MHLYFITSTGYNYNDPFYTCTPDNADNGQLNLKVKVDLAGSYDTKSQGNIQERGILAMSGDISLSLDDFVYYPLFEINSGDIGLKAELKTEKSTGQFLSLNPPEIIVGKLLKPGCLRIF